MFRRFGFELEKRPLFAFAIRKLPCSRPVWALTCPSSLSPKFDLSCDSPEYLTSRSAEGTCPRSLRRCFVCVESAPVSVRGHDEHQFDPVVSSRFSNSGRSHARTCAAL